MAVVGPAVVVGVVVLSAGHGRVGRGAVVLQVEGTIGHMLRRTLALFTVVAGAQLLRLDLRGALLSLALVCWGQ